MVAGRVSWCWSVTWPTLSGSLESRKMTLVLAKINQSGNTDALSVIEREMEKIESRIYDYEAELNAITSTPQRRGRTPPSATRAAGDGN